MLHLTCPCCHFDVALSPAMLVAGTEVRCPRCRTATMLGRVWDDDEDRHEWILALDDLPE